MTRDGDRFAPDGWRVGTAGTAATGSALEEAIFQSEEAIDQVRQLEKTRMTADVFEKKQKRALENCRSQLKIIERDHEELKDALFRSQSDFVRFEWNLKV